ncbi:MAG: NAD(P)-dependent oxidoreductase [Rhodocyclaceae bacterium]|nr:NAD(P)-dependent oxidoreductase [Rhodocyclaceae bacterium]
MKTGFIGTGAMGRPMILNLLAGGFEVYFHARRPEAAAPLVAAGAVACASPAEVARNAQIVFTIVTTGEDVEQVVFGAEGLAQGFSSGSVLVDMSTIPPGTARSIAARLAEMGVAMLDAPVSGGEVGAKAGTLAIMAGGAAEVLERVRPLLLSMGKTVVHIGGNGAGQVAKACNQMIMVAAIEACAEAFALAEKSGVDGARVLAALKGGSAGSRVLEVMGERMVKRDFAAGIEARLHHKDFRIVLNEAHALGTPLPVAAQVWQQLNALMASGLGREDTSSLLKVVESLGGI